jgi:hypothetical protein
VPPQSRLLLASVKVDYDTYIANEVRPPLSRVIKVRGRGAGVFCGGRRQIDTALRYLS